MTLVRQMVSFLMEKEVETFCYSLFILELSWIGSSLFSVSTNLEFDGEIDEKSIK